MTMLSRLVANINCLHNISGSVPTTNVTPGPRAQALCLYPPNGRWYQGEVISTNKGK